MRFGIRVAIFAANQVNADSKAPISTHKGEATGVFGSKVVAERRGTITVPVAADPDHPVSGLDRSTRENHIVDGVVNEGDLLSRIPPPHVDKHVRWRRRWLTWW